MKNLLFYPVLLLGIFLFSCSDDDDSSSSPGGSQASGPKPTITLNGSAQDTISLNSQYTELGATAKDIDGTDISSSVNINGAVDPNKTGLYQLTYTVKGSNGVTSDPAQRDVLVKNDADYLEGTYVASHVCSATGVDTDDFQTSISSSTDVNNRIFFSKLNPINEEIEGDISGVNIAIQTAFSGTNVQYSGNGVISNQDITISFNTDSSGYGSCTLTLPR
ncbi:MAG: DUF5011 domain-containing protein [Vicingaceae bacterium]